MRVKTRASRPLKNAKRPGPGVHPSFGKRHSAWWQRWSPLFESLGAVATVTGVIVALLGLQHVVTQIDEVQRQLGSSSSQVVTTQLLELDKQMMEKDAIALRGCFVSELGGVPCPLTAALMMEGHPDAPLARAIGTLHLDLFDSVFSQSAYMQLDSDEPRDRIYLTNEPAGAWNGWSNYIVRTLQASEVTCQVLLDNMRNYTRSFSCGLASTGGCLAVQKELECPSQAPTQG